MNQLNALESNQNIILILTSRFQLGPQQLAYDLYPFWVSDLGMDTILAYLNKHGKAFPENFHGLLQSPMMLTVYCETEPLSQANVNNRFFLLPQEIGKKQDLIKAFFEGFACKEYNGNGDLEKLVQNLFVHNYILPCIASHMEERFHIPYQEVKNCIRINM